MKDSDSSMLWGFKILLYLAYEPRTVPECMAEAGKSKRSIERLLTEIKEAGFEVKKIAPPGGKGHRFYQVRLKRKENVPSYLRQTDEALKKVIQQPFFKKEYFINSLPISFSETKHSKNARFFDKLNGHKGAFFTEQEETILKSSILNVYILIQENKNNPLGLLKYKIFYNSYFANRVFKGPISTRTKAQYFSYKLNGIKLPNRREPAFFSENEVLTIQSEMNRIRKFLQKYLNNTTIIPDFPKNQQ